VPQRRSIVWRLDDITTIDDERMPGDEGSRVRTEPYHRFRHIFRCADASERCSCGQTRLSLRSRADAPLVHRRADCARTDGIDSRATLAPSRAKASAAARPIPEAAPVTTATLSAS